MLLKRKSTIKSNHKSPCRGVKYTQVISEEYFRKKVAEMVMPISMYLYLYLLSICLSLKNQKGKRCRRPSRTDPITE
jgi:hypothetical protein